MNSRSFILIFLVFCSLDTFSQSPNWLWAKSAGGNRDVGTSVALDKLGNCYVTGYFEGKNFLIGDTVLKSNGKDIFIAKYSPSGKVLWAKSIGGEFHDTPDGIAVDSEGNLYLAGSYMCDTLYFENSFIKNAKASIWLSDIFIAKYNTYGKLLWVKGEGGTGTENINGIAVDSNQNIFITGSFSSRILSFGGIELINKSKEAHWSNIFTVKYGPLGNVEWAKSLGGEDISYGYNIALDNYGNPYFTGYYNHKLAFGKDSLFSLGNKCLFLGKYDSKGNPQWVKNVGEIEYGGGSALAIDSNGYCYLTGSYGGGIVFTNKKIKHAGGFDLFIIKYDSVGNEIWATSTGGTGDERANSVTVDTKGNSYITGYSSSTNLTLGNTTIINPNQIGFMIVIKYNASGNFAWAKFADRFENTNQGYSLVANNIGTLTIVGEFSGNEIKFGNYLLTNGIANSNGSTYLIAKLDTATGGIFFDDKLATNDVIVSPNPSNGSVKILCQDSIEKIMISNVLGQIINELNPNSLEVLINIDRTGIYFLTIKTAAQTAVRKLLVE